MTGSTPPPTFGFLSADLHNGASTILWSAVVQEARRLGVNLICFPGGRLGGRGPEGALRNRLYDLAGPGCLDAVITWASSLGGMVDGAFLEDFHRRLRELPLVSLSHKLEGAPVIRINAYSGMSDLITHLVEVHQFRKVAFLRGPSEHQSAQLRYQAYTDALTGHGLEPDPMLQVGPLPWDAGAEAVRILIDERRLVPGRDFQAIAAASDLLALGAFRALKDRGYRIPQDVVLVGFNGTVESVLSQPHMTTVHLPFQDQGQAAVRLLLGEWKGETRGEDLNLASRLVVRDSCGCPSRSSVLAGGHAPAGEAAPEDPKVLRIRWLAGVAALGDFGPEAIQAWFEPLGTALVDDLNAPSNRPKMLDFLDKALEHSAAAEGGSRPLEWTAWQDVVSLLRTIFAPGLDAAQVAVLDDLVDQCRVKISAFVEQRATARAWEQGQRAETLREVGRSLSEAWTVPELAAALDRIVPRLGIPGAWLVLTETPVNEALVRPGQARLVWAFQGGRRVELHEAGLTFAAADLVPAGLRPPVSPWCLVAEPLFFQDRSVGYAVFQTGPLDGAVYEELRSDLSSALKGIFLVAEAEHARQAAEKADQIKTRLLANVSHELRTPLTQILGHVQLAHHPGDRALEHIRSSAEHQLRLINDLLDLSRAEIDELDLARELLDPSQLLRTVFEESAPAKPGTVTWALAVPDRLPLLQADPLRLKQVFLNLLSNAAKFTAEGTIELGASTEPPHLHFWVRDTGAGISPDLQHRLFQPFVTGSSAAGGIGLGLSIARHLVTLHFGTLEMESAEGRGTTFHIRLPLPNLEDSVVPHRTDRQPVVLLLSRQSTPPPDLEAWVRREGLSVVTLGKEGPDLPRLEDLAPRCLCWDLTGAQPRDWGLVRQLRHHPGIFQAPFLLYGQQGLTALVDKAGGGSAVETSLRMAIEAACPPGGTRPVFVIDDEDESRRRAVSVVEQAMPGYPIQTFADGPSAWEAMAAEVPGLIILDFAMPGWDGAEVLDKVRADARLRLVPVLLLSHKVFTPEDIKRIERHTQVTLQSKGIWDARETGEVVQRLISGAETPQVHTSALVKRALAYMARHYQRALSRWQVAEAVNVSEDYLSRVFSRELGLSPWDFLNRYRIHQACILLTGTNESIRTIALQVGFNDQAYFSRVFRKAMNQTPQEYRQGGAAATRSS